MMASGEHLIKDKRVIGVLKNRARLVLEKRMADGGSKRMVLEQTLKDIGNYDEQIRGKRIPLS
jgi:hypothetical protein